MSWHEKLEQAMDDLKLGRSNDAFRNAFASLEICYGIQASLSNGGEYSSFGACVRKLRETHRIPEDEAALAYHLADARNLNAHDFGFEPSLAEAQRCIQYVHRLCQRFGVTVRQVMIKPVVTLHMNQPIRAGLELMRRHGFTYIPIVDENSRTIGTLDEWSLINNLHKDDGQLDLSKPARDAMKPPLPGIAANASVDEAIQKFKSTKSAALLILADQRPVGIVTLFDLVR